MRERCRGERKREIQGKERYRAEKQSERETGQKDRERDIERGERKILLLQTQKNSWNFIGTP